METYDHKKIESKWRAAWREARAWATPATLAGPKTYVLDMFPYPSGEGLHVGHPKGYIATDIYSRWRRMCGDAVLHPMGWDAFGLPAENYALKNHVHPRQAVEKNIARFKEQLSLLGFDYDWEREINTTDPEYYRWTQWIFLKLYERGLAYQSHEPINWCPSCQTGLANEDLEDGKCERCGSVVEKRPLRQWVLKITDYADRLLADLEPLCWPESIKESQRHWIGRSEGAEFDFALEGRTEKLTVFTTRPDTLYGVTFVAIAPELALKLGAAGEVKSFSETEVARRAAAGFKEDPAKRGLDTGWRAQHPATGESVPVWVTNYVLADVGTGAVMGVPMHDERDFEFAQKYNLPNSEAALISADEALRVGSGRARVTYRLRDWVFSRQRYWGEPIPMIHCAKCGTVPVPEKDLPVRLPEVERYEPTGTGESPLAAITDWVNTTCPTCGGPAKRETNTMPQWAGSSWYYLRYLDPRNDSALVDPAREQYWSPVDVYVGGAEHATRHLIYARFWHKFLHDIGVVSRTEPFQRLEHVGLILAEDGRKMSKRFGNVINPDEIVERYGADTLRLYEMFLGPFNQAVAWSTESIIGPRRFIERVWRLAGAVDRSGEAPRWTELNRVIEKVGADIAAFKFNTAISALMIAVSELETLPAVAQADFETLLKLLAPFAPHVTEELWQSLGHADSIHQAGWPAAMAGEWQARVKIVIQVNGVKRGELELSGDYLEAEVVAQAQVLPEVAKWLAGQSVKRTVYKPGRLINFVV